MENELTYQQQKRQLEDKISLMLCKQRRIRGNKDALFVVEETCRLQKQLKDLEEAEMIRCMDDPKYFAENYINNIKLKPDGK